MAIEFLETFNGLKITNCIVYQKEIWQSCAIKQIFHAFLFNVRNYSPEVINIQRREGELNIILPRVSNFDIKQKKAWSIRFIVFQQHQTRFGKIKANKTGNSGHNPSFFRKNWTTTYLITTPSKSLYIIFVYIFFWNH